MDVTKSERFEQLDRLLTEHDGMLQTAQVIASGIVKPIFYEYVKEKKFATDFKGCTLNELYYEEDVEKRFAEEFE